MKQLESLPYAYNALEPFIDEQTMRIHHDKHHQTYFDKFLAAIENHKELKNKDVKEILAHLDKIPTEIRTAVTNHGGGYYNHNFFWSILKKNVKFEGEIAKEIIKKWGSFEKFKEEFTNNALGVFGSGWAWLVLDKNELKIVKTSNQDSVISLGMIPLITIDVWEHAYYLKYQNKRADYVEAFFNVINWKKANEYYLEAKKNDKNK
nr:superoxide dismutase [Nanoarchaeum sp.]